MTNDPGRRSAIDPSLMRFWAAAAAFMVPLILAATLYAPSLAFDYVWDDRVLFVESSTLRLGEISWENVTRPLFESSVYVRPFAILTYMAQFKVFGPTPEMSHVVNIGLHLANIAMVMTLACMHFVRRAVGSVNVRVLVAGLMYAVHPALIEPVAWVSGRFDLLATTFVLAALIADLGIRSALYRAAAVATAFALGLGSKEVAATLPLLLIAQRLALDPPASGLPGHLRTLLSKEPWTVALCGLVAAVYMLVRMGATSRFLPPVSVSEELTSVGMRIAYVLDTLGFYLQQGLAPWWGESMPLNPADAAAVLSPERLPRTFAGLLLLTVVMAAVKRQCNEGWMIACSIASLLPVLNIVILPMAGNIGHDRFLTLPLAFVAIAIAGMGVAQSRQHGRMLPFVSAVVLTAWAVGAIAMVRATLPRWSEDLTLWGQLYALPNTKEAAEVNLITAAIREERYDLALNALARKLDVGPLEAQQQAIYGLALAHCGDPIEGMAYIAGSLQAYPPTGYAPPHWKQERGALALVRDRLGLVHYAMAEAMTLAGLMRDALEAAEESAKYRPGMLEALVLRSALRHALGDLDPESELVQAALADAYPEERSHLEQHTKTLLNAGTHSAPGVEKATNSCVARMPTKVPRMHETGVQGRRTLFPHPQGHWIRQRSSLHRRPERGQHASAQDAVEQFTLFTPPSSRVLFALYNGPHGQPSDATTEVHRLLPNLLRLPQRVTLSHRIIPIAAVQSDDGLHPPSGI